MAEVDPFMVQIPPKLMEDKETREFFEYFVRWAHDMWVRSGAGDDAVANENIQELYPWIPKTDDTPVDLTALYSGKVAKSEFEVIEVSADHTTAGDEIVICNNTAEILITLNSTPDHKEQAIIVRNGKGRVSVTSNKTISGKVTKKILRQYTAPHHIFTTESDAWNVL
jgi:hypothetical protein